LLCICMHVCMGILLCSVFVCMYVWRSCFVCMYLYACMYGDLALYVCICMHVCMEILLCSDITLDAHLCLCKGMHISNLCIRKCTEQYPNINDISIHTLIHIQMNMHVLGCKRSRVLPHDIEYVFGYVTECVSMMYTHKYV
jgi:hypothetical protein